MFGKDKRIKEWKMRLPHSITMLVGAGIRQGIKNTNKLHVMNYKRVMKSKNIGKWKMTIDKEHSRVIKHNHWERVSKQLVSQQNILTRT